MPVVKPPKQEPRVVKKEVAKKVEQKTLTVASKKTTRKRKPMVSRSPKAGGGFGKGNISNRNINQTGLLSMLGDSVGIKPQTAMAAVTNLDTELGLLRVHQALLFHLKNSLQSI